MTRNEFNKLHDFDKNFDGNYHIESNTLILWSKSPHLPDALAQLPYSVKQINDAHIVDIDQWGCERKFSQAFYEIRIDVECQACLWEDGVSSEKLFIFTEDGVMTIKTPPCDDRRGLYLLHNMKKEIIYNPDNLGNRNMQYPLA